MDSYWELSHKKYRSIVTLYSLVSFAALLISSVTVYLVFIEPNLPIVTETVPPIPNQVRLKQRDSIVYTRTFIQHRACPTNIVRQLSCADGFRFLYPGTAGITEPGAYKRRYHIPLPKDVPLGQCTYEVTLDFHCLLLHQKVPLEPILVNVVE